MEVAALRSDLARQEREILEERRQLLLRERRASRRKELQPRRPADAMAATTLKEVESVTCRPGFLRQQLAVANLTPLRRWYLQLKLMVAEDIGTQGGADADDAEAAMRAYEAALIRDRRCFDVVYRDGVRVTDARDGLLDAGAPTDAKEVLSFSTRAGAAVFRVTCVNDGERVLFSSSLFVENLQTELERLLLERNPADAAVTFTCSAIKR